jgi:hypothetical protein
MPLMLETLPCINQGSVWGMEGDLTPLSPARSSNFFQNFFNVLCSRLGWEHLGTDMPVMAIQTPDR